MSQDLNIIIPIDLNQAFSLSDLHSLISDSIINYEQSFLPLTSAICSQYDMRAEYNDGSLSIESVEVDYDEEDYFDDDGNPLPLDALNTSGHVQVSFYWSSFYGCRDMDGEGDAEDSWQFTINNRHLEFNLHIPEERFDEI